MVDLDDPENDNLCLVANKQDELTLWHRRLGHASYNVLHKIMRLKLVSGLPEIPFNKNENFCDACAQGKQTRKSFKSKAPVSTSKSYELLHMDLFGPTRTLSLNGKRFGFVIVDDFSRFTWVKFLAHKSETLTIFQEFFNKIEHGNVNKICSIRTDHGGEFDNNAFSDFCRHQGIEHLFSSPRTPEQNGVVERKNRTLVEMARTLLVEGQLSKRFWAEAVNTSCYILNRAMVRPVIKKTPYHLLKDKKPNLGYFRVFGSKVFIHNNDKSDLDKFEAKSDQGVFLGSKPLVL